MERIIREFAHITPVMTTERWDEECMMKSLKTVKIKGVQGPGVNPSGDILLGSVLFEDFTWLGIGLWIFIVAYTLKQEISAILLFSFVGDAVEVPERLEPVDPSLTWSRRRRKLLQLSDLDV